MDARSREFEALRTTADVVGVLAQFPHDQALRALHASVERDRRRLLDRMAAGGYARLSLPGRIQEPLS